MSQPHFQCKTLAVRLDALQRHPRPHTLNAEVSVPAEFPKFERRPRPSTDPAVRASRTPALCAMHQWGVSQHADRDC